MKKPGSMKALEDLGRVRLSPNFFMRDFLYSEIAAFYGIANIPDDPDLAIAAGTRLCEGLLEPLHATFGHVAIRSAYRSCDVNGLKRQRLGEPFQSTGVSSGTPAALDRIRTCDLCRRRSRAFSKALSR